MVKPWMTGSSRGGEEIRSRSVYPSRRIGLLFLALVLGTGALALRSTAGASDPEWKKVVRVDDGDSIRLEDGRRVRYLGIDAPEMGEAGKGEFLAEEAASFNRRLVLGREVRLELEREERDRYERLLAQVVLRDGRWVNEALVAAGLAHVLYQPPNTERFESLLRVQRKALDAGRGIWQEALRDTEAAYRASEKSRKFHRPDCPLGQRISPVNLKRFQRKKEAYWRGYSPCRVCRP